MSKSKKDISDDDIEFLVDLLLETSMSISQIANELGVSISDVNSRINQLGLSWLKQSRKKMSRGQTALTAVMQKLLPSEEIINEFHIGDKMRLDVYCPSYAIAAEYHGRQHFYYTSRFFPSRYEFEEAQKRDIKKAEWCKENGIALIVFRYNDSLTETSVYNRMLEAIRSTPMLEKNSVKKSITSSKYYQEMKKKNSQYKKDLYRKIKGKKIDDTR
jgi:hypothetical protein